MGRRHQWFLAFEPPEGQYSPGYPKAFPQFYFNPALVNWNSLAVNIVLREYGGEYTPSAFTLLTVLIPVSQGGIEKECVAFDKDKEPNIMSKQQHSTACRRYRCCPIQRAVGRFTSNSRDATLATEDVFSAHPLLYAPLPQGIIPPLLPPDLPEARPVRPERPGQEALGHCPQIAHLLVGYPTIFQKISNCKGDGLSTCRLKHSATCLKTTNPDNNDLCIRPLAPQPSRS